MSLLLDALNKADQDRKRGGENPTINSNHDVHITHSKAKPGNVIMFVIAGLLLVILLMTVYWLGKKTQQPTAQSIEPIASKQPAGTAQQNELTTANHSSISLGNNNEKIATPVSNNNEVADEENIASLYQHQATNTVPIPNSTTTNNEAKPQVETNDVANTQTQTASPASPTTINQFANLPDIQDLPNSILQKIPTLKYSEHNYNNNGGSVVINGVVRHANDQLIEGLFIDKILADGMILHFENYSFKMRAMNTWINM